MIRGKGKAPAVAMEDYWSLEEDAAPKTFRHFTRGELEKIENKIFEKKLLAKKRADKRAKNIQACDATTLTKECFV